MAQHYFNTLKRKKVSFSTSWNYLYLKSPLQSLVVKDFESNNRYGTLYSYGYSINIFIFLN